MKRNTRRLMVCTALVAALVAAWVAALPTTLAAEPNFYQTLAKPCRMVVSNMPLDQAVNRLRELHQINIWLDRRIDPKQPISLAASQLTVEQSLQQLAMQSGADVSFVSRVAIVGPRHEVENLATHILAMQEQWKSENNTASAMRLLKPFDLQWPLLSTPNDVLQTIRSESGVTFAPSALPHDLWAQGHLKQVNAITASLLLGSGFAKTVRFHGDPLQGTFVDDVSQPLQATLEYPPSKLTPSLVASLRKIEPALVIKPAGALVAVSASAGVHHRIGASGNRSDGVGTKVAKSNSEPANTLIESLRLENRAGDALKGVCQACGLNLNIDAADHAKLQSVVRLEMKNTNVREILHAICDQAGLTIKIDTENVVHISD